MPEGSSESGRTRLVVTVVLAVLIGTAGALLLPVLVHEAKPPEASSFRAEIGIGVPPGGLTEDGVFRFFAVRHDLRLSIEQPIPAGTEGAAVLDLLAAPLRAAGWPQDAQPTVAGGTRSFRPRTPIALSFPSVTSIGGAVEGRGAGIWISVGSRVGQSLALRIRAGACAQGADERVRAAWSARPVFDDGVAAGEWPAGASVSTDWVGCTEALPALARALQEAGWRASIDEQGSLVVQALPDGTELGSGVLTVAYLDAAPPSHDWSIEIVP